MSATTGSYRIHQMYCLSYAIFHLAFVKISSKHVSTSTYWFHHNFEKSSIGVRVKTTLE